MIRSALLMALTMFAILAEPYPAKAETLAWTDIMLPVTFNRPGYPHRLDLNVVLIHPDDGRRHPLALISHGSPRDSAAYRELSPFSFFAQAQEFARRGWTAAIVIRRGYGRSGSDGGDHLGPCQARDYAAPGRYAADDLRQAIEALAQQPSVDAQHVLAVGVSAGGFASVALAADPPPGLVAVVSFAGGRGSSAPDQICDAPALIDAFRVFGRQSRVPMLWVYAENDHFFGPDLAHRMLDAFREGGGSVDFIAAPSFGDDGHSLFSKGIPLWTPYVDSFLAGHGIALRKRPIELSIPEIAPAPALSANGREAFRSYLAATPHKAFAMGPDGAFGWRSGVNTRATAEQEALEACQKHSSKPCRVIQTDDPSIP